MNNVRKDYERIRLYRYESVPCDVEYTQSELTEAHRLWATSNKGRRFPEWDTYCDIRDAVPRGTNQAIRMGKLKEMYH